jgi:hypothetical protein
MVALAFAFAACGKATPSETPRTEKNELGLITCSPKTKTSDCYTNRAIMGISMGAGGAGQLGFARPELFDAVGMLGIPIVDWVFMLRNMERGYFGGFCDRSTIVAHLDQIDVPGGPAFCGPEQPVERMDPSGRILEPHLDYNDYFIDRSPDNDNLFSRNMIRASLKDISRAFGNAMVYNPESPYLPPGVGADFLARTDDDRCAHPVVLHGFVDNQYNPDGSEDVITVCDTDTSAGAWDPMHPAQRAEEVLLAVDYNKNGVRDYGEPIIVQLSERFRDVGLDPGDVYDWERNPTGRAGNWIYDEGEPFDDSGLDGVPGTGDYGEGNGKFDYNPNVLNLFAQSPRSLIETMSQGQLDRISIWCDAGIRDSLVSAGGMNWLWGSLRARVGSIAQDYDGFHALLPSVPDYDFLAVDYSPAAIGRHAYLRYGDPDATMTEIANGDGSHIGTPDQILDRLATAMSFVSSRFRLRDMRAVENPQSISAALLKQTYHSNALDDDRGYGIVLPPGYDDPANAEERYPVIYYLHGQSMDFSELLSSGLLYFGYMAGSTKAETMVEHMSDWPKMIIVYPDSLCRHGECEDGNFNANFKGVDGHGPRYEDALFELMAHVEATYRVAPPVEVRHQ